MEQKKTLWIIAASGVFLLVVLGAALLLNSPSSSAPATASITTIDTTPAVAKVEEPVISPVETIEPAQALDSNTLAFQKIEEGKPLEESAPQNAAPAAEPSSAAQAAAAPAETTIELNTKASSAVTATSRGGQEALSNAGSKAAASTIYTGNPGTSQASKSAASAPAASKPSQTKKTAAASAPAKKAPVLSSRYWVQAASFTNKKSADNARAALDDNKIPAEVFTYKDNRDNLFYRVRVGPYTTKSEAEYWKTRVCKIDLFKDTQSYVTEMKM